MATDARSPGLHVAVDAADTPARGEAEGQRRARPTSDTRALTANTKTSRDPELLAAWRAGDRRAGDLLIKRHLCALSRYLSARAPAHAEDLAQQTLLACLETKSEFRGEATFRSYLLGLARFQLYMHYRKRSRAPSVDHSEATLEHLAPSPLHLAAERQEARRIARALQCVPAPQRIVLEKAYWKEQTTLDIARALKIPRNTVHSRLHRAKESLRRVLERPDL